MIFILKTGQSLPTNKSLMYGHRRKEVAIHPNGGTGVQIGMEGTAACYSRPQYQVIKVYSAGAHLQRTGEMIAPSAFSCFMAASTSLRSRPLSSAILPALRG